MVVAVFHPCHRIHVHVSSRQVGAKARNPDTAIIESRSAIYGTVRHACSNDICAAANSSSSTIADHAGTSESSNSCDSRASNHSTAAIYEHKISEPQVQVSKVAEPQVVEPQVQAAATDSVNEPEKTGFVMPDYDDDYDFKVSGTSFRKENFYDILSEDYFWDMTKGELVELGMIDEPIYKYENGGGEAKLIPEPDNQYDPDAIAVYVDDTHVGYVPSKKCAKVKRLLDSGTIVYAFAEIYGGPFKIIRENDDGKYTISKKDHDFGVQVTLYIKNKE